MASNTAELVRASASDLAAFEGAQYGSFKSPAQFFRNVENTANAFKQRAEALQLYKQLGTDPNSRHLAVEGWQMLAAMSQVTAALESEGYVQYGDAIGFEATYIAKHVPTGTVISRASAMCLNNEENWGLVPKYEGKGNARRQVGWQQKPLQQLRSMAQTRAESKVLSNVFKYVAKIAGFAATPAEELTGNEGPHPDSTGSHQSKAPQQRSQTTGSATPSNGAPNAQATGNNGQGGRKITEGQRKRIFGIGRSGGLSTNEILAVCKGFGFDDPDNVTTDIYDELIATVEKRATDNMTRMQQGTL